jgi:hypothetical protein
MTVTHTLLFSHIPLPSSPLYPSSHPTSRSRLTILLSSPTHALLALRIELTQTAAHIEAVDTTGCAPENCGITRALVRATMIACGKQRWDVFPRAREALMFKGSEKGKKFKLGMKETCRYIHSSIIQ